MHGGVALRHGGSIVQRSPQALPVHASAEQLTAPAATHAPEGSQAFMIAVSAQFGTPGGHRVQPAPQAFPAHGS